MVRSRYVLRREQDAFGHALRDFHLTGVGGETIERDDGYIEAMTMADSLYFAPFDEWPTHEQRSLRHVQGRVLDVGCGTGRVALWLQEQGRDVVGLDVSPGAIEVAKQRGVVRTKLAGLAEADKSWGSFQSIVMMGNNFGLLASPASGRRILGRLGGMMPEGSVIVGSTLDPYETINPVHRAYHRRNREAGRWGGQVRIRIRYRAYKTPWFRYMFFSQKEVHRLVEPTPWKVERFYGKAHGYSVVLVNTRR